MPRKRKSKNTRYVIFAMPEQHDPGAVNLFVGRDGSTTNSRRDAAKFFTWNEAKKFATEKHIELDGVNYIGKTDFHDSDVV